jgi:hypothetical protein
MSKGQSRKEFRKEIKQPDEFVVQSNRLLGWAEENPDKLKLWGGVFVVALVLIGAYGSWTESRNQDAISSFYAAAEIYRGDQWEPALADFETIAADFDGTTYGKLANLYAGSSALHLEKYADSAKYYRLYLTDGLSSPAIEQVARMNLAAALTGAGKSAEARVELEKAAQIEGPAGPEVQLALARNFEAGGEATEAIDAYKAYLEQAPQGAAVAAIRAAVVGLGGSLPEPASPRFPGNIQVTQQ